MIELMFLAVAIAATLAARHAPSLARLHRERTKYASLGVGHQRCEIDSASGISRGYPKAVATPSPRREKGMAGWDGTTACLINCIDEEFDAIERARFVEEWDRPESWEPRGDWKPEPRTWTRDDVLAAVAAQDLPADS